MTNDYGIEIDPQPFYVTIPGEDYEELVKENSELKQRIKQLEKENNK